MVAGLVERLRVVQPAVQHHHVDRLGMTDVLERVPVEHDQVRQLPLLERPEVGVEARGTSRR